MDKSILTDYATLIFTLFNKFKQQEMAQVRTKPGKPYTFAQKCFILSFVMMHFRRIFKFKTQQLWLDAHPEVLACCSGNVCLHRTTFSRRYKALAIVVEAFITFVG